jgi:hypothetical protein
MGRGDRLQFFLGLGQGDVDAALSPPGAVPEELQRQRGLADARIAFQQQQPTRGNPPRRISSSPATPVGATAGAVVMPEP